MRLFTDIEELPTKPGVYLIKDKKGDVIYIGKAKNLKDRVKQHFSISSSELKKENYIQEYAQRIDWFETRTETEAILLERRLIRDIKPKFNVKNRDDKSSLLIRISKEEDYPQLSIARETDARVEGSIYFGPYGHDKMLRDTAKLVLKLFPICNCGRNIEKCRESNKKIRCMRKRLGQCLAPCKKDVPLNEYNKVVENVINFLNGDIGNLLDDLETDMWQASKTENFEHAAKLRDLINSVKTIMHIHQSNIFNLDNLDVIAFREDKNILSFCKILLREKRVHNLTTHTFKYSSSQNITKISDVLQLLYKNKEKPSKLLVEREFLQRFTNDANIGILYPQNKESEELLSVANKNVFHEIARYFRTKQYQEKNEELLEEMQLILQLPKIPDVIHGFDISTLGGQYSTGSCVVFVNGRANKKLYRRFRIKQSFTDPNDYAMMSEVIKRRYTSNTLKQDPLPDLIIIDGGKGHLNAVKKTLQTLDINNIPIISIAKKEEKIFVEWDEKPLFITSDSAISRLIQQIRDEAHRFSLAYSRKLRSYNYKTTIFENLKGIGTKKAQKLLTHYNGFQQIANAEIAEIEDILRINSELASQIRELAKRKIEKDLSFE